MIYVDQPKNSLKKYSYHFGIDSIKFSKIAIDNTTCFISDEIEIGYLEEDEYIQLVTECDAGESGSIEFYILDGSEPKPILPFNDKSVEDEKIFFGLRSRFSIDYNKDIVVKKNGNVVDLSLEQASNINEDGYTVSYTPVDAYNVKIKNSAIKIKAILRLYNDTLKSPYIKKVAIKKYGGGIKWNENTMI